MPINVDIVDVGKMPSQGVMMFAFELALVARKPFSVDIVCAGKMSFKIITTFAVVFAHVARKPINVDIVFAGKMEFKDLWFLNLLSHTLQKCHCILMLCIKVWCDVN